MINIQISGIEDVEAALKRVADPDLPREMAKQVADEVVQPKLAQYPAASGRAQPFVSDKQRRYFFAALRTGRIRVPYPRSGHLGSPDNWSRAPMPDGITLTSTMSYSDLVIGEQGKQAKYFVGVWRPINETAAAVEAEAALSATALLVERIGDAG